MTDKRFFIGVFAALAICLGSLSAFAQDQQENDPFKGRLFPPNVILEHQRELRLSDAQRAQIRSIVIEAQATIAEHQWDMMEAYQDVSSELDQSPINESQITDRLQSVLEAENSVKLAQVSMLVKLRNLLTADQFMQLRTLSQ